MDMDFSTPIEEVLEEIKLKLDSLSDEETEERMETFINDFSFILNGSEMEEIREEIFREVDFSGESPAVVLEGLKQAQELIAKAIEEIKLEYSNSTIKQTFCDMLGSVIETYFLSLIMSLTNRDSVTIGVELIHENAKIPTYAHKGDQGADIYAVEDTTIEPHTYGNMISTGLKMAIPYGWCISIRPRSGLSKNTSLRISNSPATIDQKYRGEIRVLFDNIGDEPITIKTGERIAQMILERNYQANYYKVDSVEPDTERGEGGFGSSGN